jgi:hypothetical protein
MKILLRRWLMVALFGTLSLIFVTHIKSASYLFKRAYFEETPAIRSSGAVQKSFLVDTIEATEANPAVITDDSQSQILSENLGTRIHNPILSNGVTILKNVGTEIIKVINKPSIGTKLPDSHPFKTTTVEYFSSNVRKPVVKTSSVSSATLKDSQFTFKYSTVQSKKQGSSATNSAATIPSSKLARTSTSHAITVESKTQQSTAALYSAGITVEWKKRGTTLVNHSKKNAMSTLAFVQRLGEFAVKPAKTLIAKTTAMWRSFQNRNIRLKMAQMKERILGKEDKHLLMTTLKVFLSVVRKSKIGYMIYGGTLLGSWRHHGLIAWDDDVDIFLNVKDKPRLIVALLKLENYTAMNTGSRVKFFSNNAPVTTLYGWKWPYLDLQFYTGNETHIWDVAREFSRTKYSRNDTFPVHIRPFEGLDVIAPAKSLKFLWAYYGKTKTCSTGWYAHKEEKGVSVVSVPCKQLADSYPFVHRLVQKNGMMEETLKFRNHVLQRKLVKEPIDSVTDPYGLVLLNQ